MCEQTCNFGYVSKNRVSGIRLCKPDGTWSGNDITCEKSNEAESPKSSSNPKGGFEYYYNSVSDGNIFINFTIC